ncbi:MAG: hypothetical protein ABI761_19450, partial [Saprospiraceae bacterium]
MRELRPNIEKNIWIHVAPGLIFLLSISPIQSRPIDRMQVIKRHTIHINAINALSSLSVGNGTFTYTADITGMQSFPDYYATGVPLGTQSSWGWHAYPNLNNYTLEETYKEFTIDGRKISYSIQLNSPERNRLAVEYFRANPHRLQLGNIGLEITKKDGTLAVIEDIKAIHQSLDLWTGILSSKFVVDNEPVSVVTSCNQKQDVIAFSIESALLIQNRLKIRIRIPSPSRQWKDAGNHWQTEHGLSTDLVTTQRGHYIKYCFDTTQYFIRIMMDAQANIKEHQSNYFIISPPASKSFRLAVKFSPAITLDNPSSFTETCKNSAAEWKKFWMSGGAIDFSGSTDHRAIELERRIILSQYLTKIQCSSSFPPQETGLTYNSWYGKPHLEMHWWHAVHFAQWGRPQLLEKSLDWYSTVYQKAKATAVRQGLNGIRWQKMTDHQGNDSPSSVGSFLIWQQPHFIYMAEMLYRAKADIKAINKYKDLVFATADFMASYPVFDSLSKKYNLGKGMIPAQESFDPMITYNPTYELAYWRWALEMAQTWMVRSGMKRNPKWDDIIHNLAPLPQKDSLYLAAESAPDSYLNPKYLRDHPAVLAAYSTLPATDGLDTTIMKKTFFAVWDHWNWNETWGWDFPLTAMTATRLHIPEQAVDALLMPISKNTYLINGHNFQDDRLTIYLPGNGGLLSAVAFMCTGGDDNGLINPGFPKDGSWKVKWEGLKKI